MAALCRLVERGRLELGKAARFAGMDEAEMEDMVESFKMLREYGEGAGGGLE